MKRGAVKTVACLVCCLLVLGMGVPLFPIDKVSAATLNVTSFGANGSDTNDDTEAIQDAIDAAQSGDTVYFPAGTYYITHALVPQSNLTITGADKETTIIKFNGTSQDALIDMPMNDNIVQVEISHLTLDGNDNPNAHVGISANNGSGHYFHNLIIRDFPGHDTMYGPFGIHFEGESFNFDYERGVTDSVISDNLIMNIGNVIEGVEPYEHWGSGIRMGWGSHSNQVLRNRIENTGRGGIFGHDGSTDLIIRGNTVTGSGWESDGEGLSIEVWGESGRAIIENNEVDHWISLDSSDYTAVRRNVISNTNGIVKFLGLEAASTSNNIFTDNVVEGGQQIGLSVSNNGEKQYNYWGYNTIDGMVQWGAQIQGDADGATRQYFYNNKFINTQSTHPAAMYPGDSGHGFRINGNTTNLTLDSNEINNNGRLGIQITGTAGVDRISFINNDILDNGEVSIYEYPSTASHLEWSNNTVSGNASDIQLTSRGFANQKPTADFSAASTVTAGQPVSFTNTSTDPDGSISYALWDFNDGIPSSTLHPTHTFEQPGTYRVTLLVWDNEGRGARTEQVITVQAASSSPIQLEAEDFSSMNGVVATANGVSNADNGDWLAFEDVDLGTGYATFTAKLAVPSSNAGQQVQVRLGSPTGTLIGTLTTASTGGWNLMAEQSTSLTGGSGIHDVYIVFVGASGVGNFDWFRFS